MLSVSLLLALSNSDVTRRESFVCLAGLPLATPTCSLSEALEESGLKRTCMTFRSLLVVFKEKFFLHMIYFVEFVYFHRVQNSISKLQANGKPLALKPACWSQGGPSSLRHVGSLGIFFGSEKTLPMNLIRSWRHNMTCLISRILTFCNHILYMYASIVVGCKKLLCCLTAQLRPPTITQHMDYIQVTIGLPSVHLSSTSCIFMSNCLCLCLHM